MMAMAKSKASSSRKDSSGKMSGSAKGGQGSSPGVRGAKAERRHAAGGAPGGDSQALTGTPDEHYNLVSVLYHALKGAQTYAQYARDAEEAGDSELAEFFEDVQEADRMRADRAKELLVRYAKRTGQGAEGEEHDE